MAEVLVAKFKSFEEQPAPPPIRRLKGQPSLLAAQPASEICYFCQKRVYIMERQAAEGVFFHRHCLKCDYCGVGLRLNNYSCEKPPGEDVKFYCCRHFAPETRTRPRRKRNFDVSGDSKENIPTTVITPAEETEESPESSEQGTPKKIIPSPLKLPSEPREKAKKTPERIEFEISFDGEEETEEEQFEHNLRASMSSDAILDNSDDEDDDDDESDDESGPEDDIFETATESLRASGGGSLNLQEVVQLANSWKRQHSTENLLDAVQRDGEKRRHPSRDAYERLYNGTHRHRDDGDDDDENDDDEEDSSTEVEGGDSEYESYDSSADEATEGESERTRGGGSTADTLEGGGTTTEESASVATNTNTNTATSPSSPAVRAARASFFSAPPQVVRLNPWRMFKKDDPEDQPGEEVLSPSGEYPPPGLLGEPEPGDVEGSSLSSSRQNFNVNQNTALGQIEEGRGDTDISESLEMDSKDEEGEEGGAEGSSVEGSIEDLDDDNEEEEEEDENEEEEEQENFKEEEERQDEEEVKRNFLEGQGEKEEEDMEVEEEEELDKTAVSLAMAQLLVDIDQTSGAGSDRSPDPDNLLPSDNDDDGGGEDVFTPTTKTKPSKNTQDRNTRTTSSSTSSSREDSVRANSRGDNRGLDTRGSSNTGDDTLQQVLRDVAAMPDLSESELELERVGGGKGFKDVDERFVTDRRRKPRLKKKLKKKKEEEKEEKTTKRKKSGGGEGGESDSDLTISTPSEGLSSSTSSSSLSEVAGYNQRFLDTGNPEEDSKKPDRDMMHDYLTTVSLALEESFSDGEGEGEKDGEKDKAALPGEEKDALLGGVKDKATLLPGEKESPQTKSSPGLESSPRGQEDEMNRTLCAEDVELMEDVMEDDEEKEAGGQDSKNTTASSGAYITPEVSMEEEQQQGEGRLSLDDFKDARETLSPPVRLPSGPPSFTPSATSTTTASASCTLTSPSNNSALTSEPPATKATDVTLSTTTPESTKAAAAASGAEVAPRDIPSGAAAASAAKALPLSRPVQKGGKAGDSSVTKISDFTSTTTNTKPQKSSVTKTGETRVIKLTRPGDSSTTKPQTKGPRKLPEVPKPRVSTSQPQNSSSSKRPVPQPPSSTKTKTLAPAPAPRKLSSDNSQASKSAVSSKPGAQAVKKTSASDSSRRTVSASSDSAPSLPRPLPRPGVARRVGSSTSSKRNNSSSSSSLSQPSNTTAKAGLKTVIPADTNNKTQKKTVGDRPQSGGGLKTVIPVDRGCLWSDSSTDHQTSDSEAAASSRKKIEVDASLKAAGGGGARKKRIEEKDKAGEQGEGDSKVVVGDIDDIPFADESEVEDRFYTPATSRKELPPKTLEVRKSNNCSTSTARKRLLPSPPNPNNPNPGLPSPTQIRSIKQGEQAKAKSASKQSWPMGKDGSSEVKGRSEVSGGGAGGAKGAVLKRRMGQRIHDDPRDRRSSSYDTPSATPHDSGDDLQHLPSSVTPTTSLTSTPASSTTDLDGSPSGRKKKASTASAAKIKMRKSKDFANKRKSEEKSQGEETKKEKQRRSLLAMLLPGKSSSGGGGGGEKVVKDSEGNYDIPEKPRVMKVAVEDRHSKKHRNKHKRNKSTDSLDDSLTSNIRDLSITTNVFDRGAQASGGAGAGSGSHHHQSQQDRRNLRPLPMAPKASVDEFSDSDESQVSVNTLLRRKDQVQTEGLDERVARKLQRVAARQQKRAEQQRLRAAQEIQRRLQEVDERQMQLEDRGTAVEKALRGEGPEADVEESQLMGEWFNLVHEKNALVRYESELMVRAKELELEDRQARLQSTFREWSMKPESSKSAEEIEAEGQLLDELLDVVEQRNALVAMLEEDRLREQQEDRELETMMVKKGFVLSPLNYSRAMSTSSTSDCLDTPT